MLHVFTLHGIHSAHNVQIFGRSEFELARGKSMPSSPIPGGRRSKRITTKQRASLVVNLRGVQKMFPCLIVDRSQEGFRLKAPECTRRSPTPLLLGRKIDLRDAEGSAKVAMGTRRLSATIFPPKTLSDTGSDTETKAMKSSEC